MKKLLCFMAFLVVSASPVLSFGLNDTYEFCKEAPFQCIHTVGSGENRWDIKIVDNSRMRNEEDYCMATLLKTPRVSLFNVIVPGNDVVTLRIEQTDELSKYGTDNSLGEIFIDFINGDTGTRLTLQESKLNLLTRNVSGTSLNSREIGYAVEYVIDDLRSINILAELLYASDRVIVRSENGDLIDEYSFRNSFEAMTKLSNCERSLANPIE